MKCRLNLTLDQVKEIQSKFEPDHEIHKYIALFLYKQHLNGNMGSYQIKNNDNKSSGGIEINDDVIKQMEEAMKKPKEIKEINASEL